MESTPQILDRWAARVARFNETRGVLLVALGGAAGMGFSILDGTTMLWAPLSAFGLLMLLCFGIRNGSLPRLPRYWLLAAVAPFFNQLALVSAELYMVLLVSLVLGWVLPLLMRAASWMLRSPGRSTGLGNETI